MRFERTLPHSIERVWRAVSDPAELERWFPAVVDRTPPAGEAFEAYGMTGEVTVVETPHSLTWIFAGDAYRFDLFEQEGGCRLIFTHTFDEGTPAAQTAAGWQTYFLRLDALLVGDHLSDEAAHEGLGRDSRTLRRTLRSGSGTGTALLGGSACQSMIRPRMST